MEALKKAASYTYWVRSASTEQAAPAPVPRKLSAVDIAQNLTTQPTPLGSLWNQAGTWEERSLNSWALLRVKELIQSADQVTFPEGRARVTEVSSCTGDATLVTVRKKKRVGYSFEITIKFKGELLDAGTPADLEGTLKVPEACFGELDDLQLEVTLNKSDSSVTDSLRNKVSGSLSKCFLPVLKGKLEQFEAELKER